MVSTGCYSPLTAPTVAILLAHFSLGALTSPYIMHRWANLAGASAPARSPPFRGDFWEALGEGHWETLAFSCRFPQKTAAD